VSSAESLIALAGGSIHEHRKATRKMRWWYESLADFMIANPHATQEDIAAHFGRVRSTISTIINTDAFKAYMRQRRAAHTAVLDATVRDKMLNVADKSMELILNTLDKKRDSIPIETLLRTTETTLKALGYGATNGPAVNVNVNNAPQTTMIVPAVGVAELEAARDALRRSQMAAPLIDVTPPAGPPLGGARQSPPLGAGAPTLRAEGPALGPLRDNSGEEDS